MILIAVFIFLLGAVTAYRFFQRLPVNNLETDLHSDQITLNASAKPSIEPEGTLFTSPSPTVAPVAPAQPTLTPAATPKITPAPLQSDSMSYAVQKGDSLWKIAKAVYGDPYQWTKIYTQNKKLIGGNPGILYVGMQLTLPSVK